ncbi:MAG: OprO/OprP family phosphate-selective porin [Ignavibacteriae bacterium]|nr:OprO/OprP family phosphate-selective porin [Ignavibacteriota bacterium]
MRRIHSILFAAFLTILVLNVAIAQDAAEGEQQPAQQISSVKPSSNFHIFGRLQTLGFMQSVKDDVANSTRMYLFLKQARLGVNGDYDGVKFNMQLAFGGEEEVKAPSPGVALSLLDLSADIPLGESIYLKVGQFKVPFSREDLTNSGYLQFGDRSIQHLTARVGRDVGVAVHGSAGMFTGTFGVFTGGGRDVPIRSIPQDLGLPMLVTRVGFNSGYDADVYTMKQTGVNSGSGAAMYVNALYTKDSKVGHSTALNVKLADKSLLLNSNWNPFIAKRPFSKGTLWQVGIDGAFRESMTETVALSGEAELNHGSYKNDFGSLQTTSGRVQGAVYTMSFEIALRYAFIKPDKNFAVTSSADGSTFSILDSKMIQEVALGISYYIKSDRVKLTADLPVLFNVPVVSDGSGAYVITQQPDQVTYIVSGGKNERQTVVDARMQIQVVF